jgi:hypothetical protein
VNEGVSIFSQHSSVNDVDNAKGLLQRYQTFSKDTNLELMRNMLDTVDVVANITKTVNNVKLEVDKSSTTSFSWRNSFNGADYSGLSINFKNRDFYSFKDDRTYYGIGGTEVNINQEEAINLALEKVEDLSWKIDGKEISDFKVVEDVIRAELLTRSKEPLELYPYWLVNLPLDNIYQGNVYAINVAIWADTAEIIDCIAQSTGGNLVPLLDESKETEQQLFYSLSSTSLSLILVVIVIFIIISILIINKKRK